MGGSGSKEVPKDSTNTQDNANQNCLAMQNFDSSNSYVYVEEPGGGGATLKESKCSSVPPPENIQPIIPTNQYKVTLPQSQLEQDLITFDHKMDLNYCTNCTVPTAEETKNARQKISQVSTAAAIETLLLRLAVEAKEEKKNILQDSISSIQPGPSHRYPRNVALAHISLSQDIQEVEQNEKEEKQKNVQKSKSNEPKTPNKTLTQKEMKKTPQYKTEMSSQPNTKQAKSIEPLFPHFYFGMQKLLPDPSSQQIGTKETFRFASASHLTASNIESLIKCPVCMEPSKPPIFTCVNGHIICNGCRKNINCCPLCRQDFSETRNLVAEQLTHNLDFDCKFQDQGCKVKLKGDEIERHESRCNFCPVKCHLFPCRNKFNQSKDINFNEFIGHLEGEHNARGAAYGRSMWKNEIFVKKPEQFMKPGRKVPFLLDCFGHSFMQCGDSDGHKIWYWVAILGTAEEAKEYFVTLTLIPGDVDDKILRHEWTGPVHSIRSHSLDIVHSGLCMVTSEPCLQSFFHSIPTAKGELIPRYVLKINVKKVSKSVTNLQSEK